MTKWTRVVVGPVHVDYPIAEFGVVVRAVGGVDYEVVDAVVSFEESSDVRELISEYGLETFGGKSHCDDTWSDVREIEVVFVVN